MRTWSLTLSILLTASLGWGQAQRGQEGNGGDVLVCQETGGLTYKFFDLHEGMKLKIPYNLGPKNLSVREKVSLFMNRLATISPNRMRDYNSRAQLLLADIEEFQALYPEWKRQRLERERNKQEPEDVFLKNTHFSVDPLMDIPDTGRTTFPANCQVKQLVIQATPKIKTDRLFQIHIDLFEKLDNDSIAMMVTHESIIPEGFENSHPDTRMSRFMNITIASDALKDMTDSQWFEHVKTVGYKYFEKDGVTATVSLDAVFDEAGRIRYSDLGEWPIPVKEGDKEIRTYYPLNVRYDENGRKLAFTIARDDAKEYGANAWKIKDAIGKEFFLTHSLGFHSNGNLRYSRPGRSNYGPFDFVVDFRGRKVKLNTKHELTIFQSADSQTIGYSNAHDNEGGSLFSTNLPPEEYLEETSIDKFVDDANLPRPYILRLVNPTFRGKPLLVSTDGYYQYDARQRLNICTALGFGEKLNLSHLALNGGEAYSYRPKTDEKPAEWELVQFKNVNPVAGFLYADKDGTVVKELICVK